MKFLHTSDWHLGRMLYGRSLLPDQEHFIRNTFLPLVREEKPDCVLLAGDLYDRAVAPAPAIRLFDETVSALAEMGVPLVAVAGNHDGADRLAIGGGLLRRCGITIASRLSDCFDPVFLEKDGEAAQIFTLPWFDPPSVRQLLGDDSLRGYHDCCAALVDKMKEQFAPGASHILTAHCFVAGSILSDSENPLFVGGSGEVHSELFEDFDYVALGHLHAPQKAGKNGRYSGSPLKYSVDEERHRKSVTLAQITPGFCDLRQVPVPPLHDVRRLSGAFASLLEAGKSAVETDYVDITLTDDAPVYLPAEQLRPYYPHLLAIHSEWFLRQNREEQAHRVDARRADRQEVLRQFLSSICGAEATEEDLAVFAEVSTEISLQEGGGPV
jgi:exonuclease SbcD